MINQSQLPPRLIKFLAVVLVLFALAAAPTTAQPGGTPSVSQRGLKICVSTDAPEVVQHAAAAVLASVRTHALLSLMAGRNPPTALTGAGALLAAKPSDRAYSHLVLVGLPGDPLIQAAWQREARSIQDGFYVFGFGYLKGDIGYIESDRNPFLHGAAISRAPYETEVITLTGSNPAGVALAVRAFLQEGMINGVVAAPGWSRTQPSLLERDPLPPNFSLSPDLPDRIGDRPRIGVTQASEDEYRGVLADTGVEPLAIWRAKYYLPGAWDTPGAENAFQEYMAGLHRRAYANTLCAAQFKSTAEAARAAPRIAGAAGLKKNANGWTGAQPPYSFESQSPGSLTLWQHGDWLLLSTLPDVLTQQVTHQSSLGSHQ